MRISRRHHPRKLGLGLLLVGVAACAGVQKPADMKTYEQEAGADTAEIIRKRYPELVKQAETHHAKAVVARDEKETELLKHHATTSMLWWGAATARSHADDLVAQRKRVTKKIAQTQKALSDAKKQQKLAESAIARSEEVIALQGKVADSEGNNSARDAINGALTALKQAERFDAAVHAKQKFAEAESKLQSATKALGRGKAKAAKSLAAEAETAALSAMAEAKPKYARAQADQERTASQRALFESLSKIDKVTAAIVEGGVMVTIVESFDPTGVDIKAAMAPTYGRIATAAKTYGSLALVIEGHTDSKGKRHKNLQLSEARAKSVMAHLASKGVSPGRMTALGKGSEEPVSNNKTREGRAKNRRIEILFATPGM